MRYHREIHLKNGKRCILRSAAASDAAEILRHRIETSGETDNLLRYPDELHVTEENEKSFLRDTGSDPRKLLLIAVIGGKIAGSAGFSPSLPVEKGRHRCEFGISILRAYWGQGLGSALLEAAVELARRAGYTRMELGVVSSNARAAGLYRKFGFQLYGRLEKAYLLRDGSDQTLELMVRDL